MGAEVFSMRKVGDNEYYGVYKAYSAQGGYEEREVRVFVQGDSLSWNQESAVWSKQ
jgi:hypothetical protein